MNRLVVILKGLKENHLDDNTVVVFMADHGNNLGKHDKISKNNIYEESLSISFIIYWQAHIKLRIDNAEWAESNGRNQSKQFKRQMA
jgi:arylsulfatase A-like enzyme